MACTLIRDKRYKSCPTSKNSSQASMLVLTLLLVGLLESSNAQQKCAQRNYGNGGTVCVCNSTYCDTVPKPQQVPQGQLLIYTSNKAGLRFEQTNERFEPLNNTKSHILIDSSLEFQPILGFGGAFTDATGININSLPETLQETLLGSYFGPDGIGYSLGRVPIGGTDFSTRPYSYDDGPEDPQLTNFQLAPEDFNFKIPHIRKALNLTNGDLMLFCSAWTAPKWMKTNDEYSGFGFIRKSMYQSWADYYVRFLDAYQNENISFWGLTTGNEPADILNPFDILEVVGWPSWLISKWISDNLGPTIRTSNYSDITIMILDDQRIFLPWYLERALKSYDTRQYINGIAVHWYLDEYVSPKVLTETQILFPDLFILGTEACNMPVGGESAVMLGSWIRGEKYSFDIIQDLSHWVTGWVDWNLVLDSNGGPNYIGNFVDAPVIVNATSAEFYRQPMFYHLGHFSKFVPPGSMRVHSELRHRSNVYVVAFLRPDNGTVAVLLNRNSEAVPVNIKDGARGTTALELSGNSITTILYW